MVESQQITFEIHVSFRWTDAMNSVVVIEHYQDYVHNINSACGDGLPSVNNTGDGYIGDWR